MREIVDAHHHLWDLDNLPYKWLAGPPFEPSVAGNVGPIAKNYLLEDYKADAAGYRLVKSVHIDARTADELGETRWIQKLCDAEKYPIAIVAGVQLHRPNAADQLAKHAEYPAVRGIRHILNWDADPNLSLTDRSDFMTDPDWLTGFAALNRLGLNFDLQIYPWQLEAAAELASRFPDCPIILNHAGMPLHQHGIGLSTWQKGMRNFAKKTNTSVKISGLGMVDWNWTTNSIRPIVREIIEIFGTNRCMFASNFPVDRLYSGFDHLYSAFEEIVADFSASEQDAMFRRNAERIYRF